MILVVAGCSSPEEPSPTPAHTPVPTAMADASTATPTPGPSPTATETPTARTAGTYLALGDSLAVGVGASRPDETGYVTRLFRALSTDGEPWASELVRLAVSGETSTSMIRDGQLVAALDAVTNLDPPVALVTLDIGGNDLLRLLGTEECAAAPGGAACLQLLALTLEDFETNYRQIVSELMTALPSGVPLAVMTYFNPFSGTDASHEAASNLALLGSDGQLDCGTDDPQARGMNDVIACVGDELGAIPVDIQPAFEGLGLELTHIASEDIHANDRGYELIADAFLAALR